MVLANSMELLEVVKEAESAEGAARKGLSSIAGIPDALY